ncbi:putative selenate ABC transporter substrate-binding protein [Simiduia agarivorans]|uniref:Phosphonate ABC transporter periplasmic phosphonate-binding protein n=1 Tax=Simiduia agarivorans (strain DSM 21679 / JCM 13881 / BCRC 17597 / SA1) TaxID=1117647 RepID=K4KZM7_SIMAS|nr:putative selenate ABC transporter substrate-binding protein [Simiduia agarivorans]AFU99387.1 phosphonate ABC transporter periplasmic phosphonate-binding protein [Simiduia agarivorans SA1 = DSM 21679]
MRLLTALAALLVSLGVGAASTGNASEAQPEFTFTAIPDQNEAALRERFGAMADYLSGALGLKVHYVPVKSYPAAITAFRNNQVQLAWFGGLSGVQARALVPGSQALAQGYEDQFFKTYFIAHKSAGIAPAEQLTDALKGKTFTFGSKGSTSGRLMPEFYVREQFAAAPEQVFSRVGFSGDHSRTLALVASGAYQVGALNYSVWDQAVANGEVNTDDVQVIWTTPTYPDYQWSARGDLDAVYGEGFTQKLRAALLNMNDAALLKSFARTRFVPASNDFYQPIEDTAKAIGLMNDW